MWESHEGNHCDADDEDDVKHTRGVNVRERRADDRHSLSGLSLPVSFSVFVSVLVPGFSSTKRSNPETTDASVKNSLSHVHKEREVLILASMPRKSHVTNDEVNVCDTNRHEHHWEANPVTSI